MVTLDIFVGRTGHQNDAARAISYNELSLSSGFVPTHHKHDFSQFNSEIGLMTTLEKQAVQELSSDGLSIIYIKEKQQWGVKIADKRPTFYKDFSDVIDHLVRCKGKKKMVY